MSDKQNVEFMGKEHQLQMMKHLREYFETQELGEMHNSSCQYAVFLMFLHKEIAAGNGTLNAQQKQDVLDAVQGLALTMAGFVERTRV